MRHAKPYRKLSRQRSHYRALMRNMALSLFQHEKIETTEAKGKEVRGFVDQIITLGKAGGLHNRRRAMALMGNKSIHQGGKRVDIVGKVFEELSKRYAGRNGGYTKMVKTGYRPGDAAPKVILELVDSKPKAVKEKPTAEASTAAAPKAKKEAAPKKTEKKAAAGK